MVGRYVALLACRAVNIRRLSMLTPTGRIFVAMKPMAPVQYNEHNPDGLPKRCNFLDAYKNGGGQHVTE